MKSIDQYDIEKSADILSLSNSKNYKRLEPLDALRGLAAIIVVLVHLRWVCGDDIFALPFRFFTIIDFGSTGVILFFVISGFSLDLTMANHMQKTNPNVSYAMSRFFRIAPLFYFMIPLTVLSNYFNEFHTDLGLKNIFVNFAFLFNLFPGHQNGIVWASWTIGVEVIFYAMFPIFFRIPLWASGLLTVIPYAAVALVFRPMAFGSFSWSFFAGFLPLFITGMATHRLYRNLSVAPASRGRWVFLVACAVLIVFSTVPGASENIFLRLPIAITYAALVVGALLWSPRILANRITSLFGSLSYAIYLLHFPLLLAMRPVYRTLLGELPHVIAFLAAIPLTLIVLTPLAALAHFGLEKPFDDFRRRFQFRSSNANAS